MNKTFKNFIILAGLLDAVLEDITCRLNEIIGFYSAQNVMQSSRCQYTSTTSGDVKFEASSRCEAEALRTLDKKNAVEIAFHFGVSFFSLMIAVGLVAFYTYLKSQLSVAQARVLAREFEGMAVSCFCSSAIMIFLLLLLQIPEAPDYFNDPSCPYLEVYEFVDLCHYTYLYGWSYGGGDYPSQVFSATFTFAALDIFLACKILSMTLRGEELAP